MAGKDGRGGMRSEFYLHVVQPRNCFDRIRDATLATVLEVSTKAKFREGRCDERVISNALSRVSLVTRLTPTCVPSNKRQDLATHRDMQIRRDRGGASVVDGKIEGWRQESRKGNTSVAV